MVETKKLLCVSTSLGGGGAERQMLALIEGLNSKGIIPDVLNSRDRRTDYPTNAKMNRHFAISKWRIVEKLYMLWRIYKIHPHIILSYDGGPNLIASIYKVIFHNCRVVVSERNTQMYPISFRNKILYYLYRYVDAIISNSKSQEAFLLQEYPKYKNKLCVITNYTNVNAYIPLEKQYSSPIKIIVFARYYPQKNTLRFLDVVKMLNSDPNCPPFVCEWYGENSNGENFFEYYLECQKKRKSLNIDNVFLNGFTRDVKELLLSADVVCLPSLYEGFSNTLSEAISMGKPLLASNVCDNSVFVRDDWNGYLFDPNSIENMVYVIKKMLLNVNRYNEFGNNSRSLAVSMFDYNEFINSYLKVLFVD